MWWILLILWTVISCAYIIKNIGNKYGGPDPWWKFALVAPAFVIAAILGCIGQFLAFLDKFPPRR